ncbi:MAG TPA: PKD domain-containing protein [Tepidisphaeraceae bacterium]|nr:PKD domain-containing protein [Tepidisphaeraceae bacterium]
MKHNTWQLLENAILETLEGRQMMSASPVSPAMLGSDGVLTVSADAGKSAKMIVDFTPDGKRIQVRAAAQTQTFAVSQVKKLVLNGSSQADYIYVDPRITIPADIHAGAGNDVIRGSSGDNHIDAGDGNDFVITRNGNNVVDGGAGNDTILAGSGNDHIDGGDGNDFIVAGAGDDTVYGGAGNDTLMGGAGNDVVHGDEGNDLELGGIGNDAVTGDSGNDIVFGNEGTDSVDGGSGDNQIDNPKLMPPAVGPVKNPTTNPTGGPTTNPTGGPTTNPTGGPTTGPTPTPTPTGDNGGAGGPNITVNPNATAPVPVLDVLDGIRQTGLSVNVNALNSQLNAGTPLTAKFEWNFGDDGSKYNDIVAYNGGHVYDTPGTYTITLTVTNEAGGQAVATQQLTITAAQRTQIFVDAVNGDDTAAGTQAAPIKTIARGAQMLGDNSELLLKAGGKYDMTATAGVGHKNVLVSRYGQGNDPVINRIYGNGTSTFATYGADGITFEHLTFDSPYAAGADGAAPKVGVSGLYLSGKNITVRNCTFLNIDDAVNEIGNPQGVIVQDNTAPLATGVRGYFVWAQGKQQLIIGNTAVNSTREHIVRMVDVDTSTLEFNDFDNADRGTIDKYDGSKGDIEIHRGQYVYVAHNKIADGDIRTGPLGLWGEDPSTSTQWVVIEDNTLTNTLVYMRPDSLHIMARSNVIMTNVGQAFTIDGTGCKDITIMNNTALDTATSGNFLRVNSHASGIVMTNNLWVAPNIVPGSGACAAVYVNEADLSSFTTIANNIWPAPAKILGWAQGGVNFVGTSFISSGFQTPDEWSAFSQVHNDSFENAQLTDSYQVVFNGQAVGSALKMAA